MHRIATHPSHPSPCPPARSLRPKKMSSKTTLVMWAAFTLHTAILTHHILTATSLSGNDLLGGLNLLACTLFAFLHHTQQTTSLGIPILLFTMQAIAWAATTHADVVLKKGWFFGVHEFGHKLASQAVLGVPVAVVVGVYPMMYVSIATTNVLFRKPVKVTTAKGITRAVAAAAIDTMLFTGYDLCIDPLGPHEGLWKWDKTAFAHGVYFGVPIKNYHGWLVVNFPTFFVLRLLASQKRTGRSSDSWKVDAAPVVSYALNALWIARIAPFDGLGLVTAWVMGLPVLLAFASLAAGDDEGADGAAEKHALGKKYR